MADDLRCDHCGVPATCVHILPWVDGDTERVELTGECNCDPGGYWFPITEWTEGQPDWGDPSRKYTMRRHIQDTKRDSARAIAMVDERLGL
jgi:hypothetical protein